MILQKYKFVRKLGGGAFGDVNLVQDQKGQLFALKIMSKTKFEKEPYLEEYLQGEIDCMKSNDSPFILKLLDNQEDKNFYYLVLEYCDGGDIFFLQSKQPEKVFSLDKATQILAEIIKGLYDLHKAGYLHRDIKPQNILIKTENNKETYKLADFGFSKKHNKVDGTVLGTDNFMSPEIYSNQSYGFEVDMWAFGVLFYFMLNMEYPFKLNPYDSMEKKRLDLIKLSKDFSYRKFVEESKKQKLANCTPEVQNLFKRIFDSDPKNRITFDKIREHPLFKKHFPILDEASSILYSKKFEKKFESKFQQKNQKKKNLQEKISELQENAPIAHSYIRQKDLKYPREKDLLERKKDQIDFLKDVVEQFRKQNYYTPAEISSLSFNLTKYYIILLEEFIGNLTPNLLSKLYPNLAWSEFCKTKQFKQIQRQAENSKLTAERDFNQLYDECSYYLKEINEINPEFKAAYNQEITEKSFENEQFKKSYRKSTHAAFNTLRKLLKGQRSGNKLHYHLATMVIAHVFNHIFHDVQHIEKIFQNYLKQRKITAENINYNNLREWMCKASPEKLTDITKKIIQLYFT